MVAKQIDATDISREDVYRLVASRLHDLQHRGAGLRRRRRELGPQAVPGELGDVFGLKPAFAA